MAESTPTEPAVVLPHVRRILISRNAVHLLGSEQWEVHSPWSVVFLPPGQRFPYRVRELWVYIQLVGGVGPVRLGVEMRQVRRAFRNTPGEPDFPAVYRHVGVQVEGSPFDFPRDGHRLMVRETAIRLTRLPFREEGTYEFRVIAHTNDGHQVLAGLVDEVTVLDPAGGV